MRGVRLLDVDEHVKSRVWRHWKYCFARSSVDWLPYKLSCPAQHLRREPIDKRCYLRGLAGVHSCITKLRMVSCGRRSCSGADHDSWCTCHCTWHEHFPSCLTLKHTAALTAVQAPTAMELASPTDALIFGSIQLIWHHLAWRSRLEQDAISSRLDCAACSSCSSGILTCNVETSGHQVCSLPATVPDLSQQLRTGIN